MLDGARRAPSLVSQLVPAPHTLEVDSTIQKLLAEGYLGEVLAVELQAGQGNFVEPDAPMHWRQDASLSGHNILNMGIWYEAMSRWLGPASLPAPLTSRPRCPRARARRPHRRSAPDHVDILAIFGAARGPSAVQLRDRARASARGPALRRRGTRCG
jgi:predicted dehydrogenase